MLQSILFLILISDVQELNDLYSSHNIFRVIKSRIKGWAGHIARMGESKCVYRFLVKKHEGKRPFGKPSLDGMKILQWIFRKWDVRDWIDVAQERDR